MVAGKVARKVGAKVLKKGAKSSVVRKAGAGAAAATTAELLEDNPYVSAAEGAIIGASVAGPVGAVAGGLVGWFMADGERIAPCDLVAIPAYEMALLRQGMAPSFQIFIKEGELIAPILPTDAMQNTAALEAINEEVAMAKPKRTMSKWNKYVANKKNHIVYKSGKNKGKLNLKAMAKKGGFGKKKRGK